MAFIYISLFFEKVEKKLKKLELSPQYFRYDVLHLFATLKRKWFETRKPIISIKSQNIKRMGKCRASRFTASTKPSKTAFTTFKGVRPQSH